MIPEQYREKKVIVMGTGGSGKTVFAKQLWEKFKCPFAYDVNGDFKGCKGGVTYYPHDIDGEIENFIDAFKKIDAKKKIDALFFDDADSYIGYELAHNPVFKDLIVRHRNLYKVSLVFICKRPQNLPTLVVENAHTLVIYLMEGVNAVKRVQDVDEKIVPLLEKVFKKEYSWILKREGKPPVFNNPVAL